MIAFQMLHYPISIGTGSLDFMQVFFTLDV